MIISAERGIFFQSPVFYLVDFKVVLIYSFSENNMDEKSIRVKRPFLGMHFKCCNIYTRIYLNKKGTAFVGWCPKCAAKVEVKVSPTGADARFFTAG